MHLGKTYELNNMLPPQPPSVHILRHSLVSSLMAGTELDAAATPEVMLGEIPTVVEFLDRWGADI